MKITNDKENKLGYVNARSAYLLVMNIWIRQHQFFIQFMCYCHFDNLYLLQSHICDRWRFSKILHRSTGFHLEMTGFHCSKTLPMLKTLFTETVAQGPMANTVHNFWAMVQECDVHLIVMLTEVSGASKVDLKTCHLISSSDQVPDCSKYDSHL